MDLVTAQKSTVMILLVDSKRQITDKEGEYAKNTFCARHMHSITQGASQGCRAVRQGENRKETDRAMEGLWAAECLLTKLLKANNDVQPMTTLGLENFTKHNIE